MRLDLCKNRVWGKGTAAVLRRHPLKKMGMQKRRENGSLGYREIYRKKPAGYKIMKRWFDIVVSFTALLLLAPVFAVTALAVFLTDGGPVFFAQYRAGKDMKPFKMYKFRSMCRNAEELFQQMQEQNEQSGHAFKIKNDPRITKVGRFIRKYSIDELPQLLNVLKGDMSIVGPRPILTFQMEECDAYQKQRLLVQPGLTCYWQISGRANVEWDEWVEMDLKYIEDMGLWTDLRLIVKTVPAVFRGDGAY